MAQRRCSSKNPNTSQTRKYLQSGDNIYGVIEFLAKNGGLTDASIWFIDADPAISMYDGELPSIVVGYKNDDNVFSVSDDWATDLPVGYDFAIGLIPSSANATKTPSLGLVVSMNPALGPNPAPGAVVVISSSTMVTWSSLMKSEKMMDFL